MSGYNNLNGTGENKLNRSSKERSAEIIHSPKNSPKDESPKAGEQKSPIKLLCNEESPNVKSPKISVEKSPEKDKSKDELKCFESTPDKDKTAEKSPSFSDIVDKFDAGLESSESFHEEISSEILGEDTPEKDKSSESCGEEKSSESFGKDKHEKVKCELLGEDTLDKDKSEKNISKLSVGGVSQVESEKVLSPKLHPIVKCATVPAEKKAAKEMGKVELLKSPEKRKPRINRRSFHLHGAFLDDLDEPKSEKADKSSVKKVDAPKGKIISLSSVKKRSSDNIPVEKKKIVLKRKLSSSIEEEEKSEPTKETGDPPKKKKIQLITWP